MAEIQFFSQKTNSFYQLLPTSTIPVLRINGIPMHRFSGTDPLTDVLNRMKVVKPHGKVLDICSGLGYNAIYSAKRDKVEEVISIEKDDEVLRIAKMNDASKEFFSNKKIKGILGNAEEVIKTFSDNTFDCIIHDPPTFVMAPELFSKKFHKELFRVLKKKGVLWHYLPEPGKMRSKESHSPLFRRVFNQLEQAGFSKLEYDKNSSGVIGIKL